MQATASQNKAARQAQSEFVENYVDTSYGEYIESVVKTDSQGIVHVLLGKGTEDAEAGIVEPVRWLEEISIDRRGTIFSGSFDWGFQVY